jgi:hypothetical protein
VNEAYAAAADDAIAEAERVRDRWFAAGDTRAALAKRLIGFLVEQRDEETLGTLEDGCRASGRPSGRSRLRRWASAAGRGVTAQRD